MSKIRFLSPKIANRSRFYFALLFAGSIFLTNLALRIVLYFSFTSDASTDVTNIAKAFFTGLQRDLYLALCLTLPLVIWLVIIPERWFGKFWHRCIFSFGFFLFWTVYVFTLAAEYYFFEEFHSRFNTVAVDYLLYPHEIFINIWDSYPVPIVIGICATAGLGWIAIARKLATGLWTEPVSLPSRLNFLAWTVVMCLSFGILVGLTSSRVNPDRVLGEISNNGALSFWSAFWTRHLDYAVFYRTIPLNEAYQRTRRLLTTTNSTFVGTGNDIRRNVAGDATRPRLNVVLLLEESLGSEFWGCLGRKGATLTPEMDKLATEEGMLFENLYASGNRTVRGLEGVLASFPPLPGDSIVKRDRSQNVETIARVLKRDGYNTMFLYGGRGLFDGMRSFALENGYDRFVEQSDFEKPSFKTVWGVSDEEIFARANQEFRTLSQTGKPFFGTVLSVSNHKPYTYPAGRIPENPDDRKRENAVKYSDYALGQFFRAAKQERYWTNTIFVVVADHGARVYGSLRIPIASYEIPMVILGPAVVQSPSRVPNFGGSLDVAPTILGQIGRPYQSMFFGRDLLGTPAKVHACLNHNRDVGLATKDRMVVLGLKKNVEYYHGNPKAELKQVSSPSGTDVDVERDAISLYQVADDLYINRRYRIDGASSSPANPPSKK